MDENKRNQAIDSLKGVIFELETEKLLLKRRIGDLSKISSEENVLSEGMRKKLNEIKAEDTTVFSEAISMIEEIVVCLESIKCDLEKEARTNNSMVQLLNITTLFLVSIVDRRRSEKTIAALMLLNEIELAA